MAKPRSAARRSRRDAFVRAARGEALQRRVRIARRCRPLARLAPARRCAAASGPGDDGRTGAAGARCLRGRRLRCRRRRCRGGVRRRCRGAGAFSRGERIGDRRAERRVRIIGLRRRRGVAAWSAGCAARALRLGRALSPADDCSTKRRPRSAERSRSPRPTARCGSSRAGCRRGVGGHLVISWPCLRSCLSAPIAPARLCARR